MSTNSTPGRRARMATTGRFVKPPEPMTQERLDAIQERNPPLWGVPDHIAIGVHGAEVHVVFGDFREGGAVVQAAPVLGIHEGDRGTFSAKFGGDPAREGEGGVGLSAP